MPRAPVSALVTSFNEVDQIEECLRSVLWADEVLLIDSFSTDGTVELVREKFPTVRIEQRKYLGAAAQKNWGIDQLSHDWVLVVDCDERVTRELRDEILKVLERPRLWAYAIYRRNFVLDREVKFSGLQRDRVTRLFHRKHARYPNVRVHTDLAFEGELGILQHKFLHNYVRSFDHMTAKMTRYGLWAGTQLFLDGERSNPADILTHTVARFLRDYFLNLGILDGARGLIIVGIHAYYTFWKYTKLWEFTELERKGKTVPLVDVDSDRERWKMPWERDEKEAVTTR